MKTILPGVARMLFLLPAFLTGMGLLAKEPLDFKTIILRVRENSELIQSQKYKIEELSKQANQAGAWQNPFLYGELGNLRDPQNDSLTYEFRLTQPFYFPGKPGKFSAVLYKDKEIQEIRLEEMKLALALDAVYYAFSYKIAGLKSEHNDSRVKRFSLVKTFMRNRPFASPQKRIERNIVANQLVTLQKDLNFAVADTKSLWERLNLYLNESSKREILAPLIENLNLVNEERFIERVRKGNYELLVKRKQLEKVGAEIALQKSLLAPDIQATLFFRREEISRPGANQFFGAGLTMPIPLVNRNSKGIEAVETKVKSLQSELAYLEREVEQNTRALLAEFHEKRNLLDSFKEKDIQGLESQMRYADKEFKLGRVDLVSYLGLEVQAHETLHSFYDTQRELVRLLTRMIFLSGNQIEFNGDLNVYQVH